MIKVIRLILLIYCVFFTYSLSRAGDHNFQDTDTSGLNKTNSFFDTLHTRASKNRWSRELFEIMVVPTNISKKPPEINKRQSISYDKYNGKLIRKIYIKNIDVFGPEVYDTSRIAENFVEKAGNRLHINTRNRIIRNHLILKPGHYFNNMEVADNERILRNLASINDARIIVSHYDHINNTVDLTVIVKDVWSKGFGLSTSDFSSGNFDFWDRNFLGTGHDFSNQIIWDTEREPQTGYHGQYYVRNIYGSFIDSKINYYSVFDHHEYNFQLLRNFYSPGTKYAGGIQYTNSQHDKFIMYRNISDTFKLDFEHTNVWMARAFHLTKTKLTNYRSNIIFSLGLHKYDYYSSPPVQSDLFYEYQSRAIILGGISFTNQGFYKTNYLYSFGRTEDIPVGMLASLYFGYETNEFKDRYYTMLNLKTGYYYLKTGYLFNSFNFNFFTNKNGVIEQGAVQYRLNYFTDLMRFNQFRFRQFVKANFTTGFARYGDEYVTLNKNEGIRGFKTDSLRYQKKLVFNFESVLFTPLYFYGFRFVLYGFTDVGFTGPTNKNILTNKPYTGFGLGIRIRSDRLTFRILQFQFGFYPEAPPDMDRILISLSGESRLRPENFYVKEPDVFIYK